MVGALGLCLQQFLPEGSLVRRQGAGGARDGGDRLALQPRPRPASPPRLGQLRAGDKRNEVSTK